MYERFSLLLGRVLTTRLQDLKREEGQGVTEYGIAVAFVVIALAAVLTVLRGYIADFIDRIGTDLQGLPGSF